MVFWVHSEANWRTHPRPLKNRRSCQMAVTNYQKSHAVYLRTVSRSTSRTRDLICLYSMLSLFLLSPSDSRRMSGFLTAAQILLSPLGLGKIVWTPASLGRTRHRFCWSHCLSHCWRRSAHRCFSLDSLRSLEIWISKTACSAGERTFSMEREEQRMTCLLIQHLAPQWHLTWSLDPDCFSLFYRSPTFWEIGRALQTDF